MATIKEDFIQHLLDQSTVTALTGTTRIRPNRFPQNETGDRIVVVGPSTEPEHHLRGASTLISSLFDVRCESSMQLAAATLADTVRVAIDGFVGTMNASATVSLCRMLDLNDTAEQPKAADEKGYPSVTMRFEIWHTVSVLDPFA